MKYKYILVKEETFSEMIPKIVKMIKVRQEVSRHYYQDDVVIVLIIHREVTNQIRHDKYPQEALVNLIQ